MRAMWKPNSADLDEMVAGINPDELYNRNDACKAMTLGGAKVAGSIFDRAVRLNSLYIAYGKVVESGRFKFYPGSEIVKQLERLRDGRASFELFKLYYEATDEEFVEKVGKPKSEVFADGTYLQLGGWRGRDW